MAILLLRPIAAPSRSLRKAEATLVAQVLAAAPLFTQLVMTARVSQSSRKEMPAVVAEAAAQAADSAVATAICNGLATAAIFISCKAAEFIPSASQHRPQMKMLRPLQQQAVVVVADAAEEMPAQLLRRQQPRAHPQLRVE